MDWQGRHVIVTGGSSGIGKATALRLARHGANISILARDPQKLALAQAEIAALSNRIQVFSFAADLSERSQAEQAVSSAVQALGAPDLLVTSAGIAHPGYFRELPIEIFEQTMAINYFGTLYCIKAVLPHMETGGGHIALIGSGAGLIGIYGYTPYSPSKFAVRGLAEALRGELKVWNIGVSIVYPADTDTPQLEAENRTKPAETKQITATAQMWSAEDMATAIVRGIERKAFVIAPGQEMTVLAKLHSLIAPGLNWYFDRIVRRVRSAAPKP
jgi:3-dehydrosphinganine reductase